MQKKAHTLENEYYLFPFERRFFAFEINALLAISISSGSWKIALRQTFIWKNLALVRRRVRGIYDCPTKRVCVGGCVKNIAAKSSRASIFHAQLLLAAAAQQRG